MRAGRRLFDLSGVDLDLLAWIAVTLRRELKQPFVLVAPESSDAHRIAEDLRFFTGDDTVTYLPSITVSPYGDLSPDRNTIMRLLAAQARLAWDLAGPFTVLAADALVRLAIPPDALVEASYVVAVEQNLDRRACLRALADGGYHAVGTVVDPGTFAVRGHILDVFPPHLERPVRVELWGDEVESIRLFDPETQRTREDAGDSILFPPVREEFLVGDFAARGRKGLLSAAAELGVPSRKLQPVLDDLANGIPFMGIEAFRPCFFESLVPITTYFPDDAIVLMLDPMGTGDRLRDTWSRLSEGYEGTIKSGEVAVTADRHGLPPSAVITAFEGMTQMRAHLVQIVDELGAIDGPDDSIRFDVPYNGDLSAALTNTRGDREPLRPLAEQVRTWTDDGARVVFACRQLTQLERVERLLKNYGVDVVRGEESAQSYLCPPGPEDSGAVMVLGDVSGGFRLLSHGFALISESEIFGRKAPRRRKKRGDSASPFIQNFRELEPGNHVVHVDHGIGRYVGLKKLVVSGVESDFLVIEFAGKDKLFLPVYKLGRLQKFVGGSQGNPRMDKLGGTAWGKVRAKAQKSAEKDAYALLDLYARRELAKGYAFSKPDDYFRTFEATFPFEETPDQGQAIEEVIEDMCRPRPMDRLLCGDVGFGKTEVALRAAMKAVVDGKQVALLVPTTVLALQHVKTFKTRFADYPVRVELLSRLVPRATQTEIIKDIKLGRVDIVVGTHRLLSKSIIYQDLGLLILDEEHRFGVKHKEKLKEIRSNVDVLAMTATPIPRTLQMSLSGIRDLSVITTPPNDRLSVRTFVCRSTEHVVRDAILRELGRGGQVFFVHNRVHSIENRRSWLTSLVPEARIVVGHGQMDPKKLEKVMLDFTDGRYNILLATTIIESGIDIPTANTMLVDHADNYGLAQLYQLRGRVGRSRERGYCYLLVAAESAMTTKARKRLAVIQKFTELGSGFHVASHDLELRGAGEMLGTRQKGQMQAVGIDLYAQLLEEAVRTLRGETPPVEFDPEINLQVSARLPEEYIPDNHLRLVLYKRLANANDDEDVLAVAEEMVDRFGPLPGQVENLIEVMRIRTLARHLGLNSVDHGAERVKLSFHPQSPVPIALIIELVTDPDSGFEAPADFKLTYWYDDLERRATVPAARNCLQRLVELVTEHATVEEVQA